MSDEIAREHALDARRSFIVQAPAGSGKTELLIQRYLTLLATVDEPEQVVAITFTRKAAAEMRNRVAAALQTAAAEPPAAAAHERKTARLAAAVLERDAERGWQLAENPHRLTIETLDALNARLARRLPVLAGGVAGAAVVEDAEALYAEAARRTVAEVHGRDEPAASLAILLRRLDNDVLRLEQMLAELLPRRDQWLPYFAGGGETELRAVLEGALARLVAEELEAARALLPAGLLSALGPLLVHAAQHADARNREPFGAWLDADPADARALARRLEDVRAWRGLARLLLTRDGEWRQRVDKRLGFGPAHAEERRRLETLLAELADDDHANAGELARALKLVRSLPEPRYSASEWRTLAALRVVLRHAAAELRLVFAERQAVDFVELALAAQAALGAVDRPSDLLLALDRRIRHLLVDEFQDTSHTQLRLLELLTAGWQPDDGRTLFLVGDPMQSIYRFRDADMSLFLRVKRFGVGAVRCEPLTLERNFRSAPEVVDWVNSTFVRAFPERDDIGAGAAKFSPSVAVRPSDAGASVVLHPLESDDYAEELGRAIDVIEQERRRAPERSMAVLVQSRSHLAGLHAQLRARGLDARALDIEPPCEHQVVQDLIGLTRALTHPADRIAWLAVLRAPWCGLTWQDLAALCADDHERTVAELAEEEQRLARLTTDGRARLEWLAGRLEEARRRRAEAPFAEWIERTWISLDGPSCLDGPEDLEHAHRFFATLDRLSRYGDLDDPAELERAFAKPEAEDQPGAGGLEIMTIHRAKGLEFDTVVLLGLGREPRREPGRALYWMQRVAGDGTEELVMAPLTEAGEDGALRRFVQRAEEARDLAERTRLLYVATTRAKSRQHLIFRVPNDGTEPSRRTLLRALWPQVRGRFDLEAAAEGRLAESRRPEKSAGAEESAAPSERGAAEDGGAAGESGVAGPGPLPNAAGCTETAPRALASREAPDPESFEPVLRRLAPPTPPGGVDAEPPGAVPVRVQAAARPHARAAARPEFEWAGQPAVRVGTLVHAYLHRIAEAGVEAWRPEGVRALRPIFERELALLGLDAEELPAAASRVVDALVGVLEDERGRWILARHEDASSERRLTLRAERVLEHVQLDRTFVADGRRWIIDFKTGSHEGADPQAFLDSEVARYRAQLERYARAMAAIEARPIEVGLYFPLLKAFRSWTAET